MERVIRVYLSYHVTPHGCDHVYISVCIFIYTHTDIYIRTRTYVYIYTHKHTHTQRNSALVYMCNNSHFVHMTAHLCIHTWPEAFKACADVCLYVLRLCIHACTHVCMYACTYTYTYTHTYPHAHTWRHTHTNKCIQRTHIHTCSMSHIMHTATHDWIKTCHVPFNACVSMLFNVQRGAALALVTTYAHSHNEPTRFYVLTEPFLSLHRTTSWWPRTLTPHCKTARGTRQGRITARSTPAWQRRKSGFLARVSYRQIRRLWLRRHRRAPGREAATRC